MHKSKLFLYKMYKNICRRTVLIDKTSLLIRNKYVQRVLLSCHGNSQNDYRMTGRKIVDQSRWLSILQQGCFERCHELFIHTRGMTGCQSYIRQTHYSAHIRWIRELFGRIGSLAKGYPLDEDLLERSPSLTKKEVS